MSFPPCREAHSLRHTRHQGWGSWRSRSRWSCWRSRWSWSRGTRRGPFPVSVPPCRAAHPLSHTRHQGLGRGRERKRNGRGAAQPTSASLVRPGPGVVVVVVGHAYCRGHLTPTTKLTSYDNQVEFFLS